MRVYVPSRGRAGFIGAKNTTARWLRGATWVVPPDEQARYQRALSNVDQSASVEACSQEGIARTRRWIGLHAQGSGESKFLMADDDLTFCVRAADGLERDDRVQRSDAPSADLRDRRSESLDTGPRAE